MTYEEMIDRIKSDLIPYIDNSKIGGYMEVVFDEEDGMWWVVENNGENNVRKIECFELKNEAECFLNDCIKYL